MNTELHETLKELRQGQLNLVSSQARTEGWAEGINNTLASMNNALADVSSMRSDIATLKERDRHGDPEVATLKTQIEDVRKDIQEMKDAERDGATRQWVEGIIKSTVVGLASGGGALGLAKLLGKLP